MSGALDNDGAVASRAGDLELEGDPAAVQSGTFASTGAGTTITFAEGRFALGPAAAITGHTVVEGLAELAIPAGMTLPVPAGDRLDLQGRCPAPASSGSRARSSSPPSASRPGPGRPRSPPAGTLTVPAGATAALTGDRALVNQGAATVTGRVSVGQGSAIVNEGTLTLSGTGKVDGPGGFGTGSSGLLHNAGTLTKAGAGEGEVAVTLDNDGTIAVAAGTLVARGLLDWSAGASSGPSEGSVEVAAGTLVVPGPLKANAARLVLDGPASAVVYPDTASAGTPRRDAVVSLVRNAAGGELVLRGGRPLDRRRGVREPGHPRARRRQHARRDGVQPVGGRGPAARGHRGRSGQRGGERSRDARRAPRNPTPATVTGDVTVLTASVVSGGFAAVTGGYQAFVGPTEVKLRPPAGLQPALEAPALAASPTPEAGNVVAPAPPA